MAVAEHSIQNFAFEEHLVRVVDREGEPWFVGKDVCAALAIKNHNDALGSLDEDEKGVANADPLVASGRNGGTQRAVIVSEPGVYRLTFRSRKPEAERFKRWLAHEVLPQIRKTGVYAPDEPKPGMGERMRVAIDTDAPLAARVDAVRLARTLFGKPRARQLWNALGLPPVPEPDEWEGVGEAVKLMDLILDHEIAERRIRDLIMDAFDGDETARLTLNGFGIRVSEEDEGFWLANNSPALQQIFAATAYSGGMWRMAIRRLRGAAAHGKVRFGPAGLQARATWFPLTVLDDYCGTRH